MVDFGIQQKWTRQDLKGHSSVIHDFRIKAPQKIVHPGPSHPLLPLRRSSHVSGKCNFVQAEPYQND